VRLRERLFRRGPRCPFCREPLQGGAAAPPCGGCGVQLHAECVGELGRCPTIGCSSARPVARAAPVVEPVDETPGEARRILPQLEPGTSSRTIAVTYGVILAVFGALLAYEPRLWNVVATMVGLCTLPIALLFLMRWAAPTVASRVSLQPGRLRPGARLRVTLACSDALLRRLQHDPSTIVRAEVRCVRRGHVLLWHGVQLARLVPGDDRATFDFDPPAGVVRDRDGVWRLDLIVLQRAAQVMSESFSLEADPGP
jgi:hypothetical protein